MYEDDIFLITVLILVVYVVFAYLKGKSTNAETDRSNLLEAYSKYKEFIVDYNKSYNMLKVSPVDKVNLTLRTVIPKYEIMLPLAKYKDRIYDWDDTIKNLKLLESKYIKNNVKIILKRFGLIEEYGFELGTKLANHSFFIGMTEQMLLDVKGAPLSIVREGVLESKKVLTYNTKAGEEVFVFVDGKLV